MNDGNIVLLLYPKEVHWGRMRNSLWLEATRETSHEQGCHCLSGRSKLTHVLVVPRKAYPGVQSLQETKAHKPPRIISQGVGRTGYRRDFGTLVRSMGQGEARAPPLFIL